VTRWIIPASRRPRFDALSFGDAAAARNILSPAKSLSEMGGAVCNDFVDATLAALFSATVVYGFN
jgi:carbon starvation protein